MQLIDKYLLDSVTLKARESPRKRMNHNFHSSPSDPINRMLNAMEPGTYIRPHKHVTPEKRETFFILRGSVFYIEFEDNGRIASTFRLSASEGNFGVEITPGVFHMLISLEPGSVLYEIKDGPYDPAADKFFAEWAPEEGSSDAAGFLETILEKVKEA